MIHGCSFSTTMMNDTLTEHDMLHSCVLKYFLPRSQFKEQVEDEFLGEHYMPVEEVAFSFGHTNSALTISRWTVNLKRQADLASGCRILLTIIII